MKTVALQIFGEFRCWNKVLDNNLYQLSKLFNNHVVDVYILTDKNDGYSLENELAILELFAKYNLNVKWIQYWSDLIDYHYYDNYLQNKYDNFVRLKNGLKNNGYNNFTAKLWHRRYILNLLFLKSKTIKYDIIMAFRLFDTYIKILKPFDFLENMNDRTIWFSHDTLFIGSEKIISRLLNFGHIGRIYDEKIWKNKLFCHEIKNNDLCLFGCKPTYCSEMQIYYYIISTFKHYYNIRFDHTNHDKTMEESDKYIHIVIAR